MRRGSVFAVAVAFVFVLVFGAGMRPAGPYLIDARWLGRGGPGRVAELTLRALAELAPEGEWLVWGPPPAAELWPAAELIVARHDPHSAWSQREFPGPRGRGAAAAFFPHQMRPLWRLARHEVTILHDTIPLRHGQGRLRRAGVKALLLRAAALSDVVMTGSGYARETLVRDLGLDRDRIVVSGYPPDLDVAQRVRRSRAGGPPHPVALFVGRASPHKNLDRLVDAFGMTKLNARGGELVLAGVDGAARLGLAERAAAAGARVRLPGIVDQGELERLMACAAVLVQPSLEEGFGLPVVEALQAGVPVAVSTAGPLVELTGGAAPSFDPLDTDAMAAAIDAAAGTPAPEPPAQPTLAEFARTIVDLLTGSGAVNRPVGAAGRPAG